MTATLEGTGLDLGELADAGGVRFGARSGAGCVWIVAFIDGREVAALRAGDGTDSDVPPINRVDRDGTTVFEFSTSLGALRVKVVFPAQRAMVRVTTSLLARGEVAIRSWPRDLHVPADADGRIHATQRGLRTGIAYASSSGPQAATYFYWQNFSALREYFTQTKRSPADTVGGTWPELGYLPPSGDGCILAAGREYVISDAYLTIAADAPATESEVAALYLDLLADTYRALDKPATTYHDWPARAERTLRDLSLSPQCTYVHNDRRYVMPYVGDTAKPPESMVQLTVTVNTLEYDGWRKKRSQLASVLRATVPSFFDDTVGSLVRWLPGATFDDAQADDNMNHSAMDSWYLLHSLFNLSRLARSDRQARELLKRSLPYAVRVARRFDYQWPIFFDLRTLDIIRAESSPGKGGEHDVGGLYALLMLHAHEIFGGDDFLAEAQRGVAHLSGLGFDIGYQMNTTGFAAEASMRLWKLTGERQYLELSEVIMANIFDNMWIWECGYGHAAAYRTFFGLFPLHDAPYLAAYEELEAQAKFHDYASIGGDDVRPSLRMLLAEFQKYSLDRGWFYYPDALPADGLAPDVRNGHVDRALSVPLEDLQDGWKASGEVGQEIYGAGLPFVYTSRHYAHLADGCIAYCDYPAYNFARDDEAGRASWKIGGDARERAQLRIIPVDADLAPVVVSVTRKAGRTREQLSGSLSVEGHAVFEVPGDTAIEITLREPSRRRAHSGTIIGGLLRAESPSA